jgi:DNA-binding XRE family transcriptional regulator
MPDIARVLKDEINRLARRQVRAMNKSLVKQVRELRQITSGQKDRIARLERTIGRLQIGTDVRPVAAGGEEASAVRMGPASVKRLRDRLKLSQKELGQLLGVSGNTVLRWEAGKAAPRKAHKPQFAELRDIGVREARKRLGST